MIAKDIRDRWDKEQLDKTIQGLKACSGVDGCKACPYRGNESACLKTLLEESAYQLDTLRFFFIGKGGIYK